MNLLLDMYSLLTVARESNCQHIFLVHSLRVVERWVMSGLEVFHLLPQASLLDPCTSWVVIVSKAACLMVLSMSLRPTAYVQPFAFIPKLTLFFTGSLFSRLSFLQALLSQEQFAVKSLCPRVWAYSPCTDCSPSAMHSERESKNGMPGQACSKIDQIWCDVILQQWKYFQGLSR